MLHRVKRLEKQVRALPAAPGIYTFRDKCGRLLYVGKAVNLRRRVASYFGPDGGHSDGTRKLKSIASQVEFLETGSELEALLAEARAIREHNPEFNQSGTREKRHAFVKITAERFPRVVVARDLVADGGRYYGPFARPKDLADALDQLQPVFKWRRCSAMDHRRCMYLQMDRCVAPCLDDAAAPGQIPMFGEGGEHGMGRAVAYDALIVAVDRVLRGDGAGVVEDLENRMREAAEALEFERAATLRKRRYTLGKLVTKSALLALDRVVVGERRPGVVRLLALRSGRLTAAGDITLDDELETGVRTFLEAAYSCPAPGAARTARELREVEVVTAYLMRHRKQPWVVPVKARKPRLAAPDVVATARFVGQGGAGASTRNG